MAALDFAAMMKHEREQRRKAAEAAAVAGTPARPVSLVVADGAVNTLKYCPNFLNSDEAANIVNAIRTEHHASEWLGLSKRKLLNLGGVPHPDGMIAEKLPPWLSDPVLRRLSDLRVFPDDVVPNQVLLNQYGPGMGIDPHMDGPLYEPCVAIVSLLSPALLHFSRPPDGIDGAQGTRGYGWSALEAPIATVLLQPGSLVVFSDDAYSNCWHGIPDAPEEKVDSSTVNRAQLDIPVGDIITRGPRLSLTIRAVRKVAIAAGEYLRPDQEEEAQRRRQWWARSISEKK